MLQFLHVGTYSPCRSTTSNLRACDVVREATGTDVSGSPCCDRVVGRCRGDRALLVVEVVGILAEVAVVAEFAVVINELAFVMDEEPW